MGANMNPYRYDQPTGAREHEDMNTIPFPPFHYNPPDGIERNAFTPPPMRLQAPPPPYHGAQGRMSGYLGESAKYSPVTRGKMDSEPVTHSHHHSYMENNFRPQQPISYEAAPRHALIGPPDMRGPPNNPYIQSSEHPVSFAAAAAAAASLDSLSHSQERGRPFYRNVPTFGQLQPAQVPELSANAPQSSRQASQELQDTDSLPSSRPISLASLATFTAKGKGPKVAAPQGIDSGDERSGDGDMYYNSHRATGARSNPRMVAGSNAAPPAHPLQNVTRVDARGRHGQAGELISQYNHHHSPQRMHNSGQHMFPLDPGASHFQNPNFGPPAPGQAPHTNHAKHATVSAPATSAPTPAPKARPASPTGPYVMGPDDLSPTKQEGKFMAQKMMLERLGDKSANDALDIDFSKLSVHQTDHYLNLIGAPPRPRTEVEVVGKKDGQPDGMHTNPEGEPHGSMATSSQELVPGKSTIATLSPPEHQPLPRALSAHQPSTDTGGVAVSAATGHDTLATRDTNLPPVRRQEREGAMDRVKTSQFMSPETQIPLVKSIDRNAGDKFDSPAWDVGNLRRSGLIPPPASEADGKMGGVPLPFEAHREIPPTSYTGPIFGRYIGGHVSMRPDFVYRPVPWSVDTAEEAEKAKEAEETSKRSSPRGAKFPPPGIPPPPTLEESPIGNRRGVKESASDKKARINETLKWYRADLRWNEGLRERIGDIVKEGKEGHAHANGAGDTTVNDDRAERTTSLLAQAIVNLQSYLDGDAKEQAGNFANYGPVPDACCEPCKDGTFSLFDVQPGPFNNLETRK
ncbi:hypothetical protein FQN49_003587 [Arthroderma sp. PD_2]|nr:hypothetical protein FQN49_003587 [Arthroderma sp. PD_2]